jgi:cyclopropane fatty-acyl-phospholipid synthase-like methyltransferase
MISKNNRNILKYYDFLADANDPVEDTEPLISYMNKWDGQEFVKELELSLEKIILEIGVGTGRLAIRIFDKCKIFYGIDISIKSINKALENMNKRSTVKLVCDDFLKYKFDIIYSSLTFMHIKYKNRAFKKVAKLLNNNGRFVLSIDKNTKKIIEYSNNIKIGIYPDEIYKTIKMINNNGLKIINVIEKEFAYIITSIKK